MFANNKGFSKLDQSPAITRQASIIMKQVLPSRPTIIEKQMSPSVSLSGEVINICEFEIPEDDAGMYHISSQFCVRNTGMKSLNVAYYQVGIADKEMTDFEKNVKSIVCNAQCLPTYSICDGLDTVMELKAGHYVLWLNVATTAGHLEYISDCSHLRLYRL